MNEWNIQSRAHACQACGKGFADKEVYHTLLVTQKHDLERSDICQACWEAEKAKANAVERKGFISHWHGLYHAPPAAPPEAIQKESAETLLRKLIETNDPRHGPACFILAVMLERKRLLKVKEQFKRDGVRVFVYEHSKSGDVFTITDPNLQLNHMDQVQRDVSDLLANGLPDNPPTPAVETAPVEPSVAAPPDAKASEGPEPAAASVSPGEAQPAAQLEPAVIAVEPASPVVAATEIATDPPVQPEATETSSSYEPGTSNATSN